jgi:hypothetical protein
MSRRKSRHNSLSRHKLSGINDLRRQDIFQNSPGTPHPTQQRRLLPNNRLCATIVVPNSIEARPGKEENSERKKGAGSMPLSYSGLFRGHIQYRSALALL